MFYALKVNKNIFIVGKRLFKGEIRFRLRFLTNCLDYGGMFSSLCLDYHYLIYRLYKHIYKMLNLPNEIINLILSFRENHPTSKIIKPQYIFSEDDLDFF